jgi:hypothetical protein
MIQSYTTLSTTYCMCAWFTYRPYPHGCWQLRTPARTWTCNWASTLVCCDWNPRPDPASSIGSCAKRFHQNGRATAVNGEEHVDARPSGRSISWNRNAHRIDPKVYSSPSGQNRRAKLVHRCIADGAAYGCASFRMSPRAEPRRNAYMRCTEALTLSHQINLLYTMVYKSKEQYKSRLRQCNGFSDCVADASCTFENSDTTPQVAMSTPG